MDSILAQQAMGDETLDNGEQDRRPEGGDSLEVHSYDDLFPALPETSNAPATPLIVNQNNVQKMKEGSTVGTHVFRLPHEERKFREVSEFGGTGDQSKICADIMKNTGAVIEISSAKDQSLTFLITGKVDAVLYAKRCVLQTFQTQATVPISIPKEHHRFILGKKGEKLLELEKRTATKISVPRHDENSDVIKVTGPREGIDKAVHEIQSISDERSKQAYEKLYIEHIYHPFIAGAYNSKTQELVNELGGEVRISVPPPTIKKDEMTIVGEKEAVMAAKQRIEKQYDYLKRKCTTVSVEVKKHLHKYVTGYRGATLQEILSETGVSVEMPDQNSPSVSITLRATPDCLGKGLSMVYEKANSVEFAEVSAPTWIHKYLIGKQGANIRKITQDLPKVNVEFTDDKVKLEGPPSEVEKCEEELRNMANDLMERLTCKEMKIDPKYHKHIIGKQGSNVNRLKQDFDVIISFPNDESGDAIRLEGSPANVDKVAEELLSMVQKMENERQKELMIPSRFHGIIIGPKGEKIREIRERFNNVIVSFPDQGEKRDLVAIRGPKEDVEKAYNYLKQINKDLIESNHRQEVPIFKQFHKFVIGKGGANIKKIKEETDTRIDLPAEGSQSDNIVITGRKDAVEAAKEMILKIQNEMENIVQTDIMIDQKFHTSIIGAGGKLIQSIMQDCGGVNIKFPAANVKSDKVTLRGPKKDVEKAKAMLLEQKSERQLSSFTDVVRAKPKHHRFLIGKNGANIKKVRESTGARIVFPTENDTDREVITLIGKADSVKQAKSQLEDMIKELDKITEKEMTVDPKFHKYFVARRGEMLKDISDQYGGVTISFPRATETSDRVVIKGAKDCVDGAIHKIREKVEEFEATVTMNIEIPQQHHRTVMGAQGRQVKNITSDFDVQIKFPERLDENSEQMMNGDDSKIRDTIRVTGRKENCEKAIEALLALVPVTEEVEMPFDFHRFIIGQSGKDVRNMMKTYDVNINIPPQNEPSDIIKVMGQAERVKECVEALMKKRQDLEKEQEDKKLRSFELTIEVDARHHPKLIGRKGMTIQKLRNDFGVQIQLPKRDSEASNIITVSGYEENAYKAKEAIQSLVGELEDMIDIPIKIDHRVHSRLIGQRGRSIRKIMDDYKVSIKFPQPSDSDPDEVVITGLEEHAEDCKDHLLNLEEEYLQDITENEYMQQYMKSGGNAEADDNHPKEQRGFVVKGGPWDQSSFGGAPPAMQSTPNMQSTEDFPSFGDSTGPISPPIVWGPRR